MPPPETCHVCGCLITEDRGAELINVTGESAPVFAHPACVGRPNYVPKGNADFAFWALYDPIDPDLDGWESMRNIESQRGHRPGSGAADYEEGLTELVERGWAESDESKSKYRLTPIGRRFQSRVVG
jgi:hypothetical protein